MTTDCLGLMVPTNKVKDRLLRDAQKAFAAEHGLNFLDVEEEFSYTRTALYGLLSHTAYQGTWNELVEEIDDYLAKGELMLKSRGTAYEIRPRKGTWDNFKKNHAELKRLVDKERVAQTTTGERMEHFIAIVHLWKEKLTEADYSVDNLLPKGMIELATLAASNFDAYEATINSDV